MYVSNINSNTDVAPISLNIQAQKQNKQHNRRMHRRGQAKVVFETFGTGDNIGWEGNMNKLYL